MNQSALSGVTLIYPYFRSKDPVEKLFPPLGIAYLASQLKEMGIPVTMADCTFEVFDEVIDRIAASRPAIIGISIMVTMSRNAFDLLRELRERLPGTLFVAGGPLPTVNPAMFAEKFDGVFCGEGDVTFPRFCQDYLSSGLAPRDMKTMDPATYPGLFINTDGKVRSSSPVHHPSEILNQLPLPDRSGFDHRKYQAAMEKNGGLRQTTLIVTRGCPFSCDFCSKPVWGDLFRKPPLEKVFREIEEIHSLGYTCLWIADDCFTLDSEYLTAFCHEMIRREVPVFWTCLSRVDRLTPGLVDLMKRAGCIRVYLGLESGSNETLRLMNKRVTVEQGIRAVDLFSQAGIGTAGFFIVGYPGETMEAIEKTFALVLSLPLDEAWFTIPLPLPGTPLFSRVADLRQWEDWEVSNQVKFVFPSEFDERWLGRRISETTEAFRKKKGSREKRGKT
ncbi:MAG: radical SAM protein [Methanoregula sp.]|jgi:anaerobic magnesium-protoporphyrin IX monomethyl ester cyclase